MGFADPSLPSLPLDTPTSLPFVAGTSDLRSTRPGTALCSSFRFFPSSSSSSSSSSGVAFFRVSTRRASVLREIPAANFGSPPSAVSSLAEEQVASRGNSSSLRRSRRNRKPVDERSVRFENESRKRLSDASQAFLGQGGVAVIANGVSYVTGNGPQPTYVPPLPQNVCDSSAPPMEEVHNTMDDELVLEEKDDLWLRMRAEARRDAEFEPVLASYLYSTILAHRSLERALAFHLGNKLSSTTLLSTQLYNLIVDTFMDDADIRDAIRADIKAVKERDPACVSYSHCMLNFKGFLACQAYRVAHKLWNQGRISLALALQSRISEVFTVDIHPAAKIGKGVLFDHATAVVIGETASVGDNVSILHHVTLGGTGKDGGDRHPKVGNGVLIGAGATILGNIKIGDGAKIGAGSVVLMEVPPRTTAVGSPARLVGGRKAPTKLTEIPSETMDHTSFIAEWSDYVI